MEHRADHKQDDMESLAVSVVHILGKDDVEDGNYCGSFDETAEIAFRWPNQPYEAEDKTVDMHRSVDEEVALAVDAEDDHDVAEHYMIVRMNQDDLDAADLSQERLHRVPEQKAHYVDCSSCPSD